MAPSARKTIKQAKPKYRMVLWSQAKERLSFLLSVSSSVAGCSSALVKSELYCDIKISTNKQAMDIAATIGLSPASISSPNPNEPSKPPTLNNPCKDDITGLGS